MRTARCQVNIIGRIWISMRSFPASPLDEVFVAESLRKNRLLFLNRRQFEFHRSGNGKRKTRASRKAGAGRGLGRGNFRNSFLVQVIDGALRMRGRGEDRAVIVLQNFKPVRDIGGVVFARLLMQFEVGAQESGA